jgi:hypothetical protein
VVALTDASIPHLARFKRLKELDISNTGITEAGLTELKKALPEAKIAF